MDWLKRHFIKKREYAPPHQQVNTQSNNSEECNDAVFIVASEVEQNEKHGAKIDNTFCTGIKSESKPHINEAEVQDYQQIKLESFYYNRTDFSAVPIGSLLFQSSNYDLYDSDDSDHGYFQYRSMTTNSSQPNRSFTSASTLSSAYILH